MANPIMPLIVATRPPSVVDYPPGSSYGPRVIADHEFVWLRSGGARWTRDSETVELSPGDLLLVRPGPPDAFAWHPEVTTRHGYVHFSLSAPLAGDVSLVRRTGGPEDPLAALCDYLAWLGSERWDRHRDLGRRTLALLLHSFVTGAVPDATATPLPLALQRVAADLRARWADGVLRPVPLADLAAAAGLSAVQLTRLFGTSLGHPPVAAVERIRLAHAEPLLRRSNLPIAEIGRLCGFTDQYHFSRRFKAAYDVSPRECRRSGATATLLTGELATFAQLTRPALEPASGGVRTRVPER